MGMGAGLAGAGSVLTDPFDWSGRRRHPHHLTWTGSEPPTPSCAKPQPGYHCPSGHCCRGVPASLPSGVFRLAPWLPAVFQEADRGQVVPHSVFPLRVLFLPQDDAADPPPRRTLRDTGWRDIWSADRLAGGHTDERCPP